MAKSLQEQLISSGLINKKKAKQIRAEQHKSGRQKRGSAVPKNTRQELGEPFRDSTERDRELNRQRQAKSERKALAAQIRQMVQANRLPPEEDGDTTFNFVVQGKVKKIHVSQTTRNRISSGTLAIVEVDRRYNLVPSSLVEKLRKRSETCVVFHNEPRTGDEMADDDYPEHKVPDDLVW
jgi:uncharacterized protein